MVGTIWRTRSLDARRSGIRGSIVSLKIISKEVCWTKSRNCEFRVTHL